jgi:hypothetical protein
LTEQEQHTNLVVVTRVRSNRVFYTYPESQAQPSKGHPQWYGDKFDLKDETTLWAARKLALTLPRPWERYLPQKTEGFLSPSQVQRDLNRIITEMGTPANSPKRRGFSNGRTTGMIQPPRTRHQVIKKGKKDNKTEPSSPIAV